MAKPERRLSEVFKTFVSALLAVADGTLVKKVIDAIRACIGDPKASRVVGGATVAARPVDVEKLQMELAALLPGDLRIEARELVRAINQDINRRGDTWAREGLYVALGELVVGPLVAAKLPARDEAPKEEAA